MIFSHTPVLMNETIDALSIKPDGVYVDGTAGGGGHSAELKTAKMLQYAKETLRIWRVYLEKLEFIVQTAFCSI